MPFPLREYQHRAFTALRHSFANKHKRVLLVGPTGSGKTVTSAHLIAAALDRGNETLFLAHRREIIYQTGAKLEQAGIPYNLVLAGHKPTNIHRAWLASKDTLIRRKMPDNIKFVIIDEAHHAVANTYKRVMEAYPDAFILGLTATPCRADGRGLGGIFEDMVVSATVEELIEQEYLVPPEIYTAAVPSLDQVRIKMRDYDPESAAQILDDPKLIGDIVDNWHVRVGSLEQRKTIGFFTNIEHSLHTCAAFNMAGIKAEHIDGETPKERRRDILARHQSGETTVLCNVGVLTEGYDDPSIHAVILARPTKSFGLYLQMSGRGLRPNPATNKRSLIILDHGDCWRHHGSPADPVAWTLDKDHPAAERPAPAVEKIKREWRCDVCTFINQAGSVCARCGCRKSKGCASPIVVPGRLTAAPKRRNRANDKLKYWNDCLWTCIHKGWKVKRAAGMYRQRFGVWPRGPHVPHGEQWQWTAKDFYRNLKRHG